MIYINNNQRLENETTTLVLLVLPRLHQLPLANPTHNLLINNVDIFPCLC